MELRTIASSAQRAQLIAKEAILTVSSVVTKQSEKGNKYLDLTVQNGERVFLPFSSFSERKAILDREEVAYNKALESIAVGTAICLEFVVVPRAGIYDLVRDNSTWGELIPIVDADGAPVTKEFASAGVKPLKLVWANTK